MIPCEHDPPRPAECHLCKLFVTRADYHALWSGTGLKETVPAAPGLGDRLTAALAVVGVTKERVSAWIGQPCGCGERQEKLNKLGAWLTDGTKAALEKLIG